MAEGEQPPDAGPSRVSVEARPEGGVRIDDRIDRRTVTVRADRTVDPEPVEDHPFEYPQDVAVSITAGRLELLPTGACILHGPTTATELTEGDERSLPDGRSVLEVSGPVKMYVELTGPYTVSYDGEELTVDLRRPDSVVVGARTFHERPAATVTTTTDPVDLMAAVSTFGSELKVGTSKRSYPTLRGHPPTLEVGREPSIPPGIERADASVRVELPRSLDHVFAVAPLAYYLGAPVETADDPALVVDGDSYRLGGGAGFEATVERTLKRTLFMDCLVRTTYPRPEMLAERERLADVLDVDLATLKGRPFHERLQRYLEIPYETIEPHVPDWRTVAHVQPTRAGIEALPFLANALAVVRVPDRAPGDEEDRKPEEVTDGSDARSAEPAGVSDGAVDGAGDTHHVVRPPTTEAVGQAWVGPGVPIGASKVLPTAYHNRLDRDRREDGTVEVAVVCNDEEMFEEGDAAKDAYGTNQQLPFDVTFCYAASVAELADVFESNLDYVHYVGHVGADGFRCPDGALDVDSVRRVAVDIAFLNACQSYEQGCKLVEQGGIASVVTFDNVPDEGALRIGKTMARLLNQGFPIDRALSVARGRSIAGSQYLVVGDHDADIAQSGTHIPWVTRAESVDDAYRVQVSPYPTKSSGMGALFYPSIGEDATGHLVPKRLPAVTVSADRFRNYLEEVSMPVIIDGDVTWSEDAVERL
jgi:hypothetical protein